MNLPVIAVLLLIGMGIGYRFTLPVNAILSIALLSLSGLWVYRSRYHGLAGIPAVLAFIGSVAITVGQLIVVISITVGYSKPDLSWLVRTW